MTETTPTIDINAQKTIRLQAKLSFLIAFRY